MSPLRIFLSLVIIGSMLSSCRTNLIIESNASVENPYQKGKQLLMDVADKAGFATYQQQETLLTTFSQKSTTGLAKSANKFKEDTVDLTLVSAPNHVGGELTITSGKNAGEKRGYINYKTYHQKPGKEVSYKHSKSIEFQVPTLQYFIEFPFKIIEANQIKYMCDTTLNGKNYALVLASWGTIEPQKKIDQYRLWINTETMQLEIADFTVRDAAPFIWGRMVFSDFKTFDGITIATKYSDHVSFNIDKEYMRMTVHNLELNPIPLEQHLNP